MAAKKDKETAAAKEWTYVPLGSTPEERREITMLLGNFDRQLDVWALPIEWLVDSLKAGQEQPHDNYR